MSHLEQLVAVDLVAMNEVVRAYRVAEVSGELGELIATVERVTFPKRSALRTQGVKMLAKLEASGAPEQLIEYARLAADPQGTWLAALRGGELLLEGDLQQLFERVVKDVHGKFWWAAWCLDPLRRRVASESDAYPFVTSTGQSDPVCDRMLFGAGEAAVDGVALEVYRSAFRGVAGMHVADEVAVAGDFFGNITSHEPPTLEAFSLWYRQLHADDFTMRDDLKPPSGTHMQWAHARFLAEVRRFSWSVDRFYVSAARQGHAVIVQIE